MADDIIVVGNRDAGGNIWGFSIYASSGPGTPQMPRMPDDGSIPAWLSVHVRNGANRVRCEAAAKDLIKALNRVYNKLLAASPGTMVNLHGYTVTVQDIINEMNNTDYFVTDVLPTTSNGGLGTAERDSPNQDRIHYSAVEGYMSPAQGPDGMALDILVVHEVVHVSMSGWSFYQESVKAWDAAKSNGSFSGAFYPSNWSNNVEAFTNDVALNLAGQVDIQTIYNGVEIRPGGYRFSVPISSVTP